MLALGIRKMTLPSTTPRFRADSGARADGARIWLAHTRWGVDPSGVDPCNVEHTQRGNPLGCCAPLRQGSSGHARGLARSRGHAGAQFGQFGYACVGVGYSRVAEASLRLRAIVRTRVPKDWQSVGLVWRAAVVAPAPFFAACSTVLDHREALPEHGVGNTVLVMG